MVEAARATGQLAMGPITRLTTTCGIALITFCLFSIGLTEPAQAQGGIVCAYGPKKYRDCCKQSFKEHRRLSARARARDIDACMDAQSEAKKAPVNNSKPKVAPASASKPNETPASASKPKEGPVKEAAPKEAAPNEPPTREKSAQPPAAKSRPAEPGNLKDLGKLK
jgi:hypothetical protein